jgi:hypothetical protein
LNKNIPLDEITKITPDTQWSVEGNHNVGIPISYGSIPEGMKEVVPAKPLADNTVYFVSTYVNTEETGSFAGQYFKIQNGRAIEVHGTVDESTVNN